MAQRLSEDAVRVEPAITWVVRFPSDNEVRLLKVDITVAPGRENELIAPFYFARALTSGLTQRSAIALIAPEEEAHAPLPPSWGHWEDAEIIWERGE